MGFGIYIVTNGLEFEQVICDALTSMGCECELTPESGDQGVDIVAKYLGK